MSCLRGVIDVDRRREDGEEEVARRMRRGAVPRGPASSLQQQSPFRPSGRAGALVSSRLGKAWEVGKREKPGPSRGGRWKQPPPARGRLGRRRPAGGRAQGAAGAGHGRNRGVRGAWARRGGGRRAWEGAGGAGLGRCQGQCSQSGCGVQQVGTPGRPRPRGEGAGPAAPGRGGLTRGGCREF